MLYKLTHLHLNVGLPFASHPPSVHSIFLCSIRCTYQVRILRCKHRNVAHPLSTHVLFHGLFHLLNFSEEKFPCFSECYRDAKQGIARLRVKIAGWFSAISLVYRGVSGSQEQYRLCLDKYLLLRNEKQIVQRNLRIWKKMLFGKAYPT